MGQTLNRPDLVCVHVEQGSGFTDPHTLRSAPAKIAFEGAAKILIKTHGAERTGGKAHPASDTTVVSDHHSLVFILQESFFRANCNTGGVGTLITDDRETEPFQPVMPGNANATLIRVV